MKADGGLQYTSKLDEFETFVAHAKLSSLSLQPSTAGSHIDASQAMSQQSQQPPPKVCHIPACECYHSVLARCRDNIDELGEQRMHTDSILSSAEMKHIPDQGSYTSRHF